MPVMSFGIGFKIATSSDIDSSSKPGRTSTTSRCELLRYALALTLMVRIQGYKNMSCRGEHRKSSQD